MSEEVYNGAIGYVTPILVYHRLTFRVASILEQPTPVQL